VHRSPVGTRAATAADVPVLVTLWNELRKVGGRAERAVNPVAEAIDGATGDWSMSGDAMRWSPELAGARVLTAEPGHTRLELTGAAEVAALAAQSTAAGDVLRFSLEPPASSDLFHAAVGR